jgi:hypothetical protein
MNEHDEQPEQPDVAALLQEVQALRHTVAAHTELLQIQVTEAAQRQATQPRYRVMDTADVA